MKNTRGKRRADTLSTVQQLAAAMAALGYYTGENSDVEHRTEAQRLGDMEAYHMRLANALLGMAQVDAMLADSLGVSAEQMQAAHQQALISAGVDGDPGKLLQFLRWQTLRVEGPLRDMVQNIEVGPLPLAAAHAAEGLQLLLGICAAGQNLEAASPDELTMELSAAREALTNAVANIDILVQLLDQAQKHFSS